ncbi:hypothetical protein [Pasteurella canis]|uniref:hypothetical protein n=1 Tax=Pasteurella canis TaxID=753 RepID=UPI000D86C330|nr:hypothetical protein [Pasteurella canis]SPY32674.1 outer membrane lopoprotein PlpP [Pasteurella canis]
MKKSIFKTSLLVTLSTLFVACGSHNHTSVNKETQKQPQQSQKPAPQTKPQENSTQNGSTEAEKEPSPPEQPMNTENSTDKKDEMNNTDTNKNNSSKNTQSDIPDSMKDNHKPNTQVNPPQIPPKTENPSNSNNMSNKDMRKEKEKENQSISKPKLELPQGDMPSSPPLPPGLLGLGNWEGKTCDSHGNCRNSAQDPKNIYESPTPPTSKISLQLGENKENGYQFDLLGEKSDEGSVYYGYRSYNSLVQDDQTKKVHDIILGVNKNRINKENIPSHFNAEYKKENGFLYIPFATLSDISEDKHIPQYADISIMYKNGKATGQVTKTGDAKTTLFNIAETENKTTTSNYTLTVTPTGADSNIQSNDKALFEVYFLDSTTTKGDRKYITGSGSSSNKKWGGVFVAEKQDENKPSSSTSTRAE